MRIIGVDKNGVVVFSATSESEARRKLLDRSWGRGRDRKVREETEANDDVTEAKDTPR